MRWGYRAVAVFSVIAFSGVVGACSDDSSGSSEEDSEASQEAEQEGEAQESCSRDELRSVATDFLSVLTTNDDPSLLPLSSELRYTENGEEIEPGEGLWQTADATRFQRLAIDTESCGTHTQAVVDEDGADVIVGVRLQLEDGEISEIETLVTREDDYWFWDPDLLVASDEEIPAEVGWEEPVPEDRRSTRAELIEIADGYYESFGGQTVVTMDNECQRSENGQSTSAGDCGVGIGSEGRVCPELISLRRYPIVDVEAGIAVAYVLFGEALDFHMFKVVDGEIRMIDALVTASEYDSSGWDEEELETPPLSECP